MMKVTYLGHSGFLVETDDAYFLFDYYKGTVPELDSSKKMFVFVSHGHYDHYSKRIYEFRKEFEEIYYILSWDVPAGSEKVNHLRPGEETDIAG